MSDLPPLIGSEPLPITSSHWLTKKTQALDPVFSSRVPKCGLLEPRFAEMDSKYCSTCTKKLPLSSFLKSASANPGTKVFATCVPCREKGKTRRAARSQRPSAILPPNPLPRLQLFPNLRPRLLPPLLPPNPQPHACTSSQPTAAPAAPCPSSQAAAPSAAASPSSQHTVAPTTARSSFPPATFRPSSLRPTPSAASAPPSAASR